MSDAIIPEERLSSYQRWQLASFDTERAPNVGAPAHDRVEQLREHARNLGYAAGYEQGHARGQQEAEQFHALVDSLHSALTSLDQTIADRLLSLALDIARQMLGQALTIRPQLVLPVIEEAVRCITAGENGIRVVLHPADAALLSAYLSTHGKDWTIVEDESLERGGCRVETRMTEVDATLSERWRHVLATLGASDTWLPAQ